MRSHGPAARPRPRKLRAWDAGNPGNGSIRDELSAVVLRAAAGPLARGDDLLDAGCGTGWWLRRLAATGIEPARLHGIDLREERVKSASDAGLVRTGDVRALPYEDGRFGAVFMFTVLSSLPDVDGVAAAVREAWRVLAPAGALVVWEPRVPTPNRATRLITARAVEAAAGAPAERRTLTLLPPLARRLGSSTPRWYPRLARLRPLRTHQLIVVRRPDGTY